MKIAILSPIAWRTPPREYGPWEQVASNVTEGLVQAGMDVTLFATGDSMTTAALESVCETGYAEDPSADAKVWECLHISHLMEQAHRFDIIHNHFDFLPLTYSRLMRTPMVTTIHGFSSPAILPVYKKYNHSNYYVSISNADRSPELRYTATVYNGIHTGDFSFNASPDDYLLFFGRIHPDKGTREAIRIARQVKRRLIISGLIQDEAYFDEHVRPFVDGDRVIYTGNSGPGQRDRLLGHAYALLHPISFDEPFGLSVAEAMMCGTPVIAFNRGSMPELIQDGKTGFLTAGVDESAEAVKHVSVIDRRYCRFWAENRFSDKEMVRNYIDIYENVLQSHS
ncbi:glycosyltransferase family 4 protein [Proteiniphilum acetatigenes]|uniref:glycosyltransferase family 4 protein n=1 Tax=Proteiniphilum acetatigenes TaxID=294710 RepID=UPI00037EDDFB|nr:glycosyltransferase family 4 protein [Proteiniphilum acetatigenes]SFK58577.1 Glycosyltransferase involved in cell wall bisynthesis [Porphyromonadaceae bacterium KH3CP3RA]